MSWPVFLTICGAMLAFGIAVMLRGEVDERRWKRERENEAAARKATE